ncbi:hypothetical protein MCO_00696 [Bartonella sp. DB5-6]|uniref:hypothetical protein n=1 Tax=Bartonella sp. DB5-6 TaxID=1094755 RepID=UPI00026E9465|nr:hypothetical protein [Bartonella sp. DB5-6]EJF78512.1 hypothetical protein MCO_00696 [Bartonella sp. DB5-6]
MFGSRSFFDKCGPYDYISAGSSAGLKAGAYGVLGGLTYGWVAGPLTPEVVGGTALMSYTVGFASGLENKYHECHSFNF